MNSENNTKTSYIVLVGYRRGYEGRGYEGLGKLSMVTFIDEVSSRKKVVGLSMPIHVPVYQTH